jgi:hypothetical protein
MEWKGVIELNDGIDDASLVVMGDACHQNLTRVSQSVEPIASVVDS